MSPWSGLNPRWKLSQFYFKCKKCKKCKQVEQGINSGDRFCRISRFCLQRKWKIQNRSHFDWCSAIMTVFKNSLPVLKMYNTRNVNYRFSALAVNFRIQPMTQWNFLTLKIIRRYRNSFNTVASLLRIFNYYFGIYIHMSTWYIIHTFFNFPNQIPNQNRSIYPYAVTILVCDG